MATLIFTVIIGLVIAFFATQNTASITLNVLDRTTPGIPTYIVVVGALLIGLLLSWIISLLNSIATGMTIHNKESKIKDYAQENAELLKKTHQLELENTRLKAETHHPDDEKAM